MRSFVIQSILNQNHRLINNLVKELAEMKDANQEEANDLDNKYNKLIKAAKEAVDKLHAFEAEKLGMHSDQDK